MIEFSYIEIQQPIGSFYYCAIPASFLLKVVRTSPRSKNNDGVQRDLQQDRIKKISKYCSDPDAVFPTPIVISIDEDAKIKLDEEKHSVIFYNDDMIVGDVIDGQHRLWGIEGSKYADKFILPVALMFGLTLEEKAYIFSTINSNQVKVHPSLIYELFDVSNKRSPQKTVHEIARVMNNSDVSPFYNRLKMLGRKTDNQTKATLSQGTFAKSIMPLISRDPDEDARMIKRMETINDDIRCPFRNYFINNKDDVIIKILLNCFNALKKVFPLEWEDPSNNILWKTTGFGAVIYALPSIIKKGTRDKVLTQVFFEMCFISFRKSLDDLGILLNSKDFPGGGVQNQKKLAKILIESVANFNFEAYMNNVKNLTFPDFLDIIGRFENDELYELSIILREKGSCGRCHYFLCDILNDNIRITYPFYDISTKIPLTKADEALKYLEERFLGGLDIDSWYKYV